MVAWPTSELERLQGFEQESRDIMVSVQPEVRLPAVVGDGEPATWDHKDNGHPFWVIPRRKTVEETPNCKIDDQTTTVLVCTRPQPPLNLGAESEAVTYSVRIPYIFNTKDLNTDEKVILNWTL